MKSKTSGEQVFSVGSLLEARDLQLELLAGSDGLTNEITAADVQKPGLSLAGHIESLHPERVQVMGFSEISYLESLEPELASERFGAFINRGPPCLIITRGLAAPAYLVDACRALVIPLLHTPQSSSELLHRLKSFLSFELNPIVNTHGVLVDVYGEGILLLGKSGIGKSEVALDLVLRGYRLVADDIVEIQRRTATLLVGSGPDLIKHHIEIRGLGILNIKDLFGVASVRDTKRIDLVVELVEWDEDEEYDRLGLDELTYTSLGVDVPYIRLPVRPGRNMTAIIEIAARNQLLKARGHYSAREFQERLVRAIAEKRSQRLRIMDEE